MDLFYPTSQKGYYAIIDGVVIGPFGTAAQPSYQMISFDGSMSYMKEESGPYGQNAVLHEKLTGNFMYQPVFPNIIPGPSYAYPRACTFTSKEGNQTALNGMFSHGGTSMGDFYWAPHYHAFLYDPETDVWNVWRIDTFWNNWGAIQAIYQWQYWNVRYSEGNHGLHGSHRWRYATKGRNGATMSSPAIEPHKLPKFEDYMGTTDTAAWVDWVGGTVTDDFAHGYEPMTQGEIMKLTDCQSKLDAMMYMMLPETFPIKHMPSGDLVQKAAEKKRVIETNMISFLHDLKDVKSLIPKLSNLSSIKGIAGQFLSVKYGVLPTIDDLKSVWEAVHKHKPGTDAQGYDVYKASHSEILMEDDLVFKLDQRAMLAIEDEDSFFDKICEDLDNVGLLPTFENIWDLVKYSFVIDWFVNVGDFLKQIDTCLRILRYNIRYTTLSYKETASGHSIGSTSYPFIGAFNWVKYHRWVTLITPLPSISLSLKSFPISHWLEGTALVTQRIKL